MIKKKQLPNMGKKFEQNFKTAVEQAKDGKIFIYRIKDTDTSYHHTETSKYTHENLCDYFMFYEGVLYALELKSTCYKSIGFELDKKKPQKMIKAHQIEGLAKLIPYENIIAGFIFNFRDEEREDEQTYFMRIEDFNEFVVNTDKKSINAGDIVTYGGIPVENEKKRKWFTYNVSKMIDDIKEEFIDKEGGLNE